MIKMLRISMLFGLTALAVSAMDWVSAEDTCQFSRKPNLLMENWTYFPFGANPGAAGLQIATAPGEYPEILLNLGWTNWGIISNDFGPNGYSIKWVSNQFKDSYSYVRIVDLIYNEMLKFGRDQVLAVYEDRVRIFDRMTHELVAELNLTTDDISNACIGDFNGDGDPDLFTCSYFDDIKVFDLDSQALLHEYPYTACNLILGQFDDDAGQELVISTCSQNGGYVIDINTSEIEWVYYPEFGSNLAKGDIDQDGKDELIESGGSDNVIAFDLDQQSIKWEFENFNTNELKTVDIDNDGSIEVILGDGQWGSIRCLRGIDGYEMWSIENPGNGVGEIAVADVDLDGINEILWSSSSWGDNIYIADSMTKEIEWINQDLTPPFKAFDIADLDNDGKTEIAVCSFKSNNDYAGGVIMLIDAETHRMENTFQFSSIVGISWLLLEELVPSSPGKELAVNTGVMTVYNALSFDELWKTEQFISLASSFDIDKDGVMELIAVGREASSSGDNHIIVYEGSTGKIEWESMGIEGYAICLDVADIDLDNIYEIGVLSNYPKRITIVNGLSYKIDWQSPDDDIAGFDFVDIFPETPGIEILTGETDGDIQIYNGLDYSLIVSFSLDSGEIQGIQACDINKNGTMEILTAVSGQLICTNTSGDILWTSEILGDEAGYFSHIICKDINNDDVNEVLIGSDSAFYEFRCGEPRPDPTPVCEETGITLELPATTFKQGDVFYLNATVCNHSEDIFNMHHCFIILDVLGDYWFAPSWVNVNSGLDSYNYSIPSGGWTFQVLPIFLWPEIQGSFDGVTIWGALTDPGITTIVGEIDQVQFGWR